MDTGFMIASLVIGLYVCLGPFVFLALYVLFDRFAEREPAQKKQPALLDDNPALWTKAHTDAYFVRKKTQSVLTKSSECTL
ncbi:MAG: hypothetical protein GX055_01010 [Desulfovibrionales bacterium]|nr:hypothetical protein [Desulfovibrionales bacterium]